MSVSRCEEPHLNRYISVPKAVQLIPKFFNGSLHELREFIQNVESAYEVVDPIDYSLLLKFICAKIGGEAKTKLLSHTHSRAWEQVGAVLEENYSVRRTLDYYAHRAFTSRQNPNETICHWGVRKDTVCGDSQCAACKHVEDLAWANEKRKGGGDMIDLFIRACFIQGLQDDRIKTMVKAKGNVNTPMTQLVEVALDEESTIRSERFKRSIPDRGQYDNQGSRHMTQKHFECKEVRVTTVTCYRCKQSGPTARNCKEFPGSSRDEQGAQGHVAKGPGNCRNKSGNEHSATYQGNRRQMNPQEVAIAKIIEILVL
jgi:hypothetical protein